MPGMLNSRITCTNREALSKISVVPSPQTESERIRLPSEAYSIMTGKSKSIVWLLGCLQESKLSRLGNGSIVSRVVSRHNKTSRKGRYEISNYKQYFALFNWFPLLPFRSLPRKQEYDNPVDENQQCY